MPRPPHAGDGDFRDLHDNTVLMTLDFLLGSFVAVARLSQSGKPGTVFCHPPARRLTSAAWRCRDGKTILVLPENRGHCGGKAVQTAYRQVRPLQIHLLQEPKPTVEMSVRIAGMLVCGIGIIISRSSLIIRNLSGLWKFFGISAEFLRIPASTRIQRY